MHRNPVKRIIRVSKDLQKWCLFCPSCTVSPGCVRNSNVTSQIRCLSSVPPMGQRTDGSHFVSLGVFRSLLPVYLLPDLRSKMVVSGKKRQHNLMPDTMVP